MHTPVLIWHYKVHTFKSCRKLFMYITFNSCLLSKWMRACIALLLSIINIVLSPIWYYFYFRIPNTGSAQRTQKEVFSVYIHEDSQSSPYWLKIKLRSGLKQMTCHDSYSSGTLGLLVWENLPGICSAGSACVPNYPETKASPELHLGALGADAFSHRFSESCSILFQRGSEWFAPGLE